MAAPNKKKKMTRVNMTMAARTKERIEEIRDQGGGDSLSEVVRKALALYSAALDAERAGGMIVVRQPGRVDHRLILEF